MTEPDAIDARVRTAQITVASLATGILIFTGFVVGVVAMGTMAATGGARMVALPLYGAPVAGILLAIAPMVRRRILDAGPARDRSKVVARWFTATVVSMALREGVGLLGITVSLLAGSAPWAIALGLTSVAAMVLSWPRGIDLRERLKRLPS